MRRPPTKQLPYSSHSSRPRGTSSSPLASFSSSEFTRTVAAPPRVRRLLAGRGTGGCSRPASRPSGGRRLPGRPRQRGAVQPRAPGRSRGHRARARRAAAAVLAGRSLRRGVAGPVGPAPRTGGGEPVARGVDRGSRRAVGTGVAGAPLYLGALLVTGVSRFVLAGLSTALPRVVHPEHLVTANAVRAVGRRGRHRLGMGDRERGARLSGRGRRRRRVRPGSARARRA